MLMISPIPAFKDNYIWMLHIPSSKDVVVVDPGDAAVVEARLARDGLNLAGILITHHHHDHIGGVGELTRHRSIPVYGPDNPAITGITHRLKDGDAIHVNTIRFTIIATPGHTLDHIAYFTEFGDNPALFCGDTLFVGGCGRLFEGTAQQMYTSLMRLAALPGNTHIYCAHEYTQANLQFALAVEPDNPVLQQRVQQVARARTDNQPTVPSTLSQELATNPFLRSDQPGVIQAACDQGGDADSSPAEVLGIIRAWKDNF